jgi:hypothetical protein
LRSSKAQLAAAATPSASPPSPQALEKLQESVRKLEAAFETTKLPLPLPADSGKAIEDEILGVLSAYRIEGEPLGTNVASEIASELSESIVQRFGSSGPS